MGITYVKKLGRYKFKIFLYII